MGKNRFCLYQLFGNNSNVCFDYLRSLNKEHCFYCESDEKNFSCPSFNLNTREKERLSLIHFEEYNYFNDDGNIVKNFENRSDESWLSRTVFEGGDFKCHKKPDGTEITEKRSLGFF